MLVDFSKLRRACNATVARTTSESQQEQGRGENRLCRGIIFFDVTVNECRDVASSSARLICGLRDGKGVQELIEHLDGLLVLGLDVGGGVHVFHDFDTGHDVW
jgi:urease gamma subunit